MEEKKYIREPYTQGFYKQNDDDILFGTMIQGPEYFLLIDEHANYTLPIDGWYYFDDEHQARAALGLPPLEEVEE